MAVAEDRPAAVGESIPGPVRDTSRRVKVTLTWYQIAALDTLLSGAFESAEDETEAEAWVELERTILGAWLKAGEAPGLLRELEDELSKAMAEPIVGCDQATQGYVPGIGFPDLKPGPQPGRATTRELVQELEARTEGLPPSHSIANMHYLLGRFLKEQPAEILDYRTVDAS